MRDKPRRSAFFLTLFAVFAGLGATAQGAETSAKRPNLVLILCDDMGYECLSCNGSTSYKTPIIDKLAADGVRFTRCYAQPLCTPTRVQLMTGQYNVRNYIHFGEMEKHQRTFANALHDAGYATCIVGKWQLGADPQFPNLLGFDEWYLWQHLRRPPRYANPGLDINSSQRDYHNGEYGPKLTSDFGLQFIEKNKDKPFCLYYPMILVHNPFQPTPDSPDWNPKTKSEKEQQDNKHFAEMVSYADKMVGELVDKLEELKLRDNTLILFLGDNGTNTKITTQTVNGPVQGGKGKSTSAGTHVPMWVSWPGHAKGGQVRDDLVDTTDFMPTLLEAAGVPLPKGQPADGRSVLPQIKGERGNPREWVYSWYNRSGGAKASKEFAADHDYKLYRDGEFVAYGKDILEKKSLTVASLDGPAKAAYTKLKKVLDEKSSQRPPEIAKQEQKGGDE